MSTAYAYILGTDVFYGTPEAVEIRRVDRLDGVTGTAAEQAANAYADGNLPAMGAAHPTYTTAYLVSKTVRAIDVGRFEAELVYRTRTLQWDGGGEVEISSELVPYRSQYDADDAEIITGTGDDQQSHWVDRQIPTVVMRWRRVESTLAAAITDMAPAGKVNSGSFQGAGAGFVLCRHVEVTKLYQGAWLVTWEFCFHPMGWGVTVTHEDIATGKPVTDPATGEQVSATVYLETDFDTLALELQ
jgi:hypothetical protein